jgi:hypothetical protein
MVNLNPNEKENKLNRFEKNMKHSNRAYPSDCVAYDWKNEM